MTDRTCSFPECGRRHKGRGLCSAHLQQRNRGSELSVIEERRNPQIRNEHGEKRCRNCGGWFPETEFYAWSGSSDGLNPYCQGCTRLRNIRTRYNLAEETYLAMLESQDYRCSGCGSLLSGGTVAIDHDHTCCPEKAKSCGGCVRGLLCPHCNNALGYARDSPGTLRRLADYLEKHDGGSTSQPLTASQIGASA